MLTDVFRAMGLELPRPAMVTTTGVARIALVAKGHFLSMASESVLRFGGWERSIKVLPIDLVASGPVGIITLKNRTLTPVAQLFIDCAREVAKPMAMPRRPVDSKSLNLNGSKCRVVALNSRLMKRGGWSACWGAADDLREAA